MLTDARLKHVAETAGLDVAEYRRSYYRSYAENERAAAVPFEAAVEHLEREAKALREQADATETNSPQLKALTAQLAAIEEAAERSRVDASQHRDNERAALAALKKVR